MKGDKIKEKHRRVEFKIPSSVRYYAFINYNVPCIIRHVESIEPLAGSINMLLFAWLQ